MMEGVYDIDDLDNSRPSEERDLTLKQGSSLLKLVTPLTMLVVGKSSAGKSSYVRLLLEKSDQVFTETPSRVLYFYNIYLPLFVEMEQTVPNIRFVQGLPTRADIEKRALKERHLLLVFDDLYFDLINSKDMVDLTIKLCHHMNISCVYTPPHSVYISS